MVIILSHIIKILKIIELDIEGKASILMNISNWYTLRQHFWYTVGRLNKMCYGISTGTVLRLAYEMVEENNIKDNAL